MRIKSPEHLKQKGDKLQRQLFKPKKPSNPVASTLLKKRPRGMVGRRPTGRSSHQQPKIFRCPLESCGKIFHDRASLKKHNTVHGDKLFQCTHDGCGKRFLDNAKLKRHMLVHTVSKSNSIKSYRVKNHTSATCAIRGFLWISIWKLIWGFILAKNHLFARILIVQKGLTKRAICMLTSSLIILMEMRLEISLCSRFMHKELRIFTNFLMSLRS